MSYLVDFRLYSRPFCQPLKTSHGIWQKREGIILRLTDTRSRIGWGEIAPLPWFGSETLEQALEFCQSLEGKITLEQILTIPDSLPGCQFGFESGLEEVSLSPSEKQRRAEDKKKVNYSYLLPTGKAALQAWKEGCKQGIKTFKWKVGVSNIEEEIGLFETLISVLPKGVRLRLDANGGLNLAQAKLWLKAADKSEIVEFIEQPLSPLEFDLMVELSREYKTPLALDESVSNLTQLERCYRQGWKGVFVVKPAIAGFPSRLRQFSKIYSIDLVFSSVFETEIGQGYIISLAEELTSGNRSIGFGINDWFKDHEANWLNNLWTNS